jgi:hypothetical protein
MGDSSECSICLSSPYVLPVATVCGHVFCFECLQRSLGVNHNCPLCRNQVSLIVPLHVNENNQPNNKILARDAFVRHFNAAHSNHGVREQVYLARQR